MKAIKKHENYITFGTNEIGAKTLNSLISKTLKLCTIISVSNELAYYEVPMYKTQIPYSSGYIEDRFIYHNTAGVTDYIIKGTEQPDAFDVFFCQYPCWDFYDNHAIVLSINIVMGIITVDSTRIDLSEYGYKEGEPSNE